MPPKGRKALKDIAAANVARTERGSLARFFTAVSVPTTTTPAAAAIEQPRAGPETADQFELALRQAEELSRQEEAAKRVTRQKWKRVPGIKQVPADGDCFFHCMSAHVKHAHEEVRRGVCDFLQNNPEHQVGPDQRPFLENETLDNHLARMRLRGTYATVLELAAAASLFQRRLVVLMFSAGSG